MKPKVVITHWVHDEVIQFLQPHSHLHWNGTRESPSKKEVLQSCRDAVGMMVFMPDSLDEDFIGLCPNLKIVAAALKGYDNFDVEACTKHGIWFTIVPDLLTIPTAELTIGLLLGIGRHLAPGDLYIRSGDFRGWRPAFYGMGLEGRIVGIIGMGRVGQAVAKRLSGFEATVFYHDFVSLPRETEEALNISRRSLDEVLSGSDFVVALLPLTAHTKRLINREAIGKMKSGSYLINTGRGSVVDERAVREALDSGHLGGYAADVFEMEDWARPDRPETIDKGLLENTQKTLFTPHLGSAVDKARKEIALTAARNILQALSGERPKDAVNDL